MTEAASSGSAAADARDADWIEGKTVVITGASSGIGRAAAVELARRRALVVPVGRDPRRLSDAVDRIRSAAAGEVGEPLTADFSSLDEVRRLAAELLERHEWIHVLVNNAGLVAPRRTLTDDGHELTFAVNHLAPFLLTNLLLDRLKDSAPSRVITVSSDAHYAGRIHFDDLRYEGGWSSWGAYCDSKLANVMFTVALARRLEGTGVTPTSLHPGTIRTRLSTGASLPARIAWAVSKPFLGSAEHGASTIVHLATTQDGAYLPGAYFADRRAKAPKPVAADPELTERLWRVSEELLASGKGARRPSGS